MLKNKPVLVGSSLPLVLREKKHFNWMRLKFVASNLTQSGMLKRLDRLWWTWHVIGVKKEDLTNSDIYVQLPWRLATWHESPKSNQNRCEEVLLSVAPSWLVLLLEACSRTCNFGRLQVKLVILTSWLQKCFGRNIFILKMLLHILFILQKFLFNKFAASVLHFGLVLSEVSMAALHAVGRFS